MDKFKMLFDDTVSYENYKGEARSFDRRNLGDMFPTDIQAEVLLSAPILAEDILEIAFINDYLLEFAKKSLAKENISIEHIPFVVDYLMFIKERLYCAMKKECKKEESENEIVPDNSGKNNSISIMKALKSFFKGVF